MSTRDTPAPCLTTSAGAPVADNQNSLTAGDLGPVLMQDWQLIEKRAHQNRERIPERVVHAKGWGAHGVLRITGDISHQTSAGVLQPGAETPMIARFSTVAGELDAADHERDVRDFALKFYTEEGNWDLVSEPPLDLHGHADRFDHRSGNDDFSQPRALFLLFDQAQRSRLVADIAATMKGVSVWITERQIELFRQVHPEFGDGVCAALDALDPQF